MAWTFHAIFNLFIGSFIPFQTLNYTSPYLCSPATFISFNSYIFHLNYSISFKGRWVLWRVIHNRCQVKVAGVAFSFFWTVLFAVPISHGVIWWHKFTGLIYYLSSRLVAEVALHILWINPSWSRHHGGRSRSGPVPIWTLSTDSTKDRLVGCVLCSREPKLLSKTTISDIGGLKAGDDWVHIKAISMIFFAFSASDSLGSKLSSTNSRFVPSS